MNKFEIIKKVTKNPLPLGTPFGAPEVIKLITLIAATCFAGKVEESLISILLNPWQKMYKVTSLLPYSTSTTLSIS